jgi:hypothetical protein
MAVQGRRKKIRLLFAANMAIAASIATKPNQKRQSRWARFQ